MNRRGVAPALVLLVLAATLALAGAPAAAGGAPTTGPLTTFAGGFGYGPATGVAQSPVGLAARAGRLVSVDARPSVYVLAGVLRHLDLNTGIQRVLAGIEPGGYRGDGGPATSAQLRQPMDAAIDAAGNVYVTDTDNARVRKITPAGTITTFAGNGVAGFSGEGATATSASIKLPAGIAVSPAGDVVFADRGNNRVRKVSPSGIITTIAGNGQRTGPAGDGGPATAAAIEPWAVELDPAGNLYAVNGVDGALRKIRPDGTITTVAAPPFFAGAMAADGIGNIYLAPADRRTVVRLDPSGGLTTVAGAGGIPPSTIAHGAGDGGPATNAPLNYVNDLAYDGGNLYVAAGSAIRRVDQAGTITTVAGNGESGYGGDGGPALGAQFLHGHLVRSGPTGTYFLSSPSTDRRIHRVDASGTVTTLYEGNVHGMAVDDAGNVFFSHVNQILRISPAGVLTTVAGTGEAGFSGDGGPATLARLSYPQAMTLDGAGNLYFFDAYNGRIRRVDRLGIITTYVGGAQFDYYRAVELATDAGMGHVGDLAVDAGGSLHWSENGSYYDGVRKVTCGIVSTVSTGGRTSDSLAVDAAGSIFYIAGKEVRRVDSHGVVTTVAGSGGSPLVEGVPANSVALDAPTGVAIDPAGGLLFGDRGRILRVAGVTAGRTTPGTPCDTLPDRPVWGVGYNALGQLGDGTTAGRNLPAGENPALTRVTAVTGGVGHSLALRADGTVWAWGWNGYGQLGDGTTASRLRPVPVPGLTGVVAVAGGAFHSMALKTDGTVWAWGWNPFGQLGDGTVVQRTAPTPVPGLAGVVAISAGTLHSLAVKADGSVWAWGWNGVGQLGDGTVVDHRLPTRIPGLTRATGVAAGGLHSLAVKDDGSVWGWGWNLFGQLGDGTTVERHVPSPIAGLDGTKAVAAGSYHSLALRHDGTVAGWGFGNVGQVGNGTTDSSLTPVTLPTVTRVVAIAAGAFHSLAVQDDGRVMSWGWNYFGQLASHGDFAFQAPAEVAALDHTAAVGAGAYHTLFAHSFLS